MRLQTNPKTWLQLRFSIAGEQAAALSEQLEILGALSVTWLDEADDPVFEPVAGETPEWPHTQVLALFESATDSQKLLAALNAHFQPPPTYQIEYLADQDWVRLGQANFPAMSFGKRLWICPSWEIPPEPDAINIMLDPGVAFGTGTHPTTALCLEWLDGQGDLSDFIVVDYGCGSGILGIAALKLGAREVWGTDIDPQALEASHLNAVKNGVADDFKLCLPEDLPKLQADIVLANILANPLCDLAPTLMKLLKPHSALVLSGILHTQTNTVLDCYQSQCTALQAKQQDDWIRISGIKM